MRQSVFCLNFPSIFVESIFKQYTPKVCHRPLKMMIGRLFPFRMARFLVAILNFQGVVTLWKRSIFLKRIPLKRVSESSCWTTGRNLPRVSWGFRGFLHWFFSSPKYPGWKSQVKHSLKLWCCGKWVVWLCPPGIPSISQDIQREVGRSSSTQLWTPHLNEWRSQGSLAKPDTIWMWRWFFWKYSPNCKWPTNHHFICHVEDLFCLSFQASTCWLKFSED